MLLSKNVKIRDLVFGLKYVLTYRFMRNPAPLICGLVMHNKCNLNCLHCRINSRPADKLTFERAKWLIDAFYNEGGGQFILRAVNHFFGATGNICLTML